MLSNSATVWDWRCRVLLLSVLCEITRSNVSHTLGYRPARFGSGTSLTGLGGFVSNEAVGTDSPSLRIGHSPCPSQAHPFWSAMGPRGVRMWLRRGLLDLRAGGCGLDDARPGRDADHAIHARRRYRRHLPPGDRGGPARRALPRPLSAGQPRRGHGRGHGGLRDGALPGADRPPAHRRTARGPAGGRGEHHVRRAVDARGQVRAVRCPPAHPPLGGGDRQRHRVRRR